MPNDPISLEVNDLALNILAFFDHTKAAFTKYLEDGKSSNVKKILGEVKDHPKEKRAFHLIYRSLLRATISVIKVNHEELLDKIQSFHLENSDFQIELGNSINFDVTEEFFAAPHKLPLLKKVIPPYKQWLQSIGFSAIIADLFSKQLQDHFHIEIIKEWGDGKVYYQVIEDHFKNPFFQSWKNKTIQLTYYSRLKTLYFQSALGHESLKLADLYVEPYFKVHGSSYKYPPTDDLFINIKDQHNFKASLHQYINNTLVQAPPQYLNIEGEKTRLILLLGQPGQGKTSFCARLCHDLISDFNFERNLYLIKLRDLPNAKKFVNNPKTVLKEYLLEDFQLELNFSNTLLILDGLDELYLSEGLSENDINNAFHRLSQIVESNKNLHLIVTSRFNYLDFDNLDYEKALTIQLDELTHEQRTDWLEKFNTQEETPYFTKEILAKINNKELHQYQSIRELISQPILLQMVVQSGINIDEANNRSKIYEELFKLMIKRKWDKGQLEKYKKLKQEDFRAYLRILALTIYQSDHEYISFYNLKELPATKEFLEKIKNKQGINDALKDVLVSFYFKNKSKSQKDNDQNGTKSFALEFYHKSLQEYLAAERIWTYFKSKFTARISDSGEYVIDSWEKALEATYNLLGSKPLSPQLIGYLVEIIENDPDIKRKKKLAKRLALFLPDLLKRHFMPSLKETPLKALNIVSLAFYGYWMVLSYCPISIEKRRKLIPKNAVIDFCRMLRLVHKHKYYQLNLSGLVLRDAPLGGAVLEGVNFYRADLSRSNFSGADLTDGNFTQAVLRQVDFSGANFHYANLQKTKLKIANLNGAFLYGANLEKAVLEYASLSGANIEEANLNYALLKNAIVSKEQLFTAKSLYQCILDPELEEELTEMGFGGLFDVTP